MSHTKEPWSLAEVENHTGRIKHLIPVDGEKMSILTLVESDQGTFAAIYNDSDARRIVACVNALKDDSTEWLEAQNGIVCPGAPIKYRCLELEKQRDDLLAALEKCSFALEPYDDIKPRDWKSDRENLRRAHQTACEAIANVKGGES